MEKTIRKLNQSAYLNFLLSKYEAYCGLSKVKSFPYHALIDPSDICQLRCPGCWTGIENESRRKANSSLEVIYRNERGKLSPQLFDAVLDEIGEYLFVIEFHSQGEPLLNAHLPSFVRRATELGIDTQTRTNLSLQLSDERIEDLATCGLGTLIASVDGYSQEAYEKYRVGGRIDLVHDNLRRLKSAIDRNGSATDLVYQYLVFDWNEHEIEDARRFTEDLGIWYQVRDAIISDQSWLPSYRKDEKPFISKDRVLEIAQEYQAAGSNYWKDSDCHDYWIPADPSLNWLPAETRQADSFCGWHYSAAVIEPSGHLTPCCWHSNENDRVGKVDPGRTTVADVFGGKRYERIRQAYNSESSSELDDSSNLCSRCYVPGLFKHGLSPLDFLISEQFSRLYGDNEPVLWQAFELLVGPMGQSERERYAQYFEKHLASYYS